MTACVSRRWSAVPRAIRAGGVTAALVALGGLASYPVWRHWCLTWGAAPDEAVSALPGDEFIADPGTVSTRAIGIDAPPRCVWPWLAQMGPGRGGVYTYDWIENLLGLNVHSVDVVLPEHQHISVGDAQQLGASGPTLRVAISEPERALVFRSDDGHWSWAFVLQPHGTGTRLISRNRITMPEASCASRAAYRYIMEPGSLVMERKMLIGIKERAERLASEDEVSPSAPMGTSSP